MKPKKMIIIFAMLSMFLISSLSVSGNLVKDTKDKKINNDLKSYFTDPKQELSDTIYSSVCWKTNADTAASLAVEYIGMEYIDWGVYNNYWLYKYRVDSFFKSKMNPGHTYFLKQMDLIVDSKSEDTYPIAGEKGGMNVTDGNWEDGSNIWESIAVAVCSRAIAEVNPYVAVGISGTYLAFNLLRDLNHNAEYGQEVYSWTGSTTEASGYLDFGVLVKPNTNWEIELNLEIMLDYCCPQPPAMEYMDLAGTYGLMGTNGTITLKDNSPGLIGITEPEDSSVHIFDVHVEADADEIVEEVKFKAEGGLPGLESIITASDSSTDYDPEFKADLDPNLFFWRGDIIAIAKKDGEEIGRDLIKNVLILW